MPRQNARQLFDGHAVDAGGAFVALDPSHFDNGSAIGCATSSLPSLPASSRSNSSRFAPGRVTNAATATAPRPARSARTRPVSRPMSRASSSRMAERWPSSPMGMSICVPRSMPSASPHAGGSRRCSGRGRMRRMAITCTSTSCSTGRATATASVSEAIAADQSRITGVANPRYCVSMQASAIRREAGRSQAECIRASFIRASSLSPTWRAARRRLLKQGRHVRPMD
jgi:hypothetical protein